MSKRRRQTAALPYRMTSSGTVEILLVTSRDTGRWVIPKGWPMPGRKLHRAAEIEAYEEAGIEGKIAKRAIGTYDYDKVESPKKSVPCRVHVFPMHVTEILGEWPEQSERRREWFAPKDAAANVDEKELRVMLARVEDFLDLADKGR